MERKYKSEILGVIHQDAEAMYEIGVISKERMREFDEMCLIHELEPVILDPEADRITEP